MLTKLKKNQLSINIKSYSNILLEHYKNYIFKQLPIKNYKCINKPHTKKSFTVLRSPHKYKCAQEHFHLKILNNTIIIPNITSLSIQNILLNKPQGIYLKLKFKQI